MFVSIAPSSLLIIKIRGLILMSKLISLLFSVAICLGLAFLSGCATMNKSECQVANWEIIGMEDGAAGKVNSNIGKHRQACAEHGIAPNLEQYQKGYQQGISQFCTYDNGFQQGSSGRRNNGVCTGNLKQAFSQGYNKGYRIYSVRSKINKINSAIDLHRHQLQDLTTQIENKEQLIIGANISPAERRRLLNETKDLRAESDEVEHELNRFGAELYQLENEYERLTR